MSTQTSLEEIEIKCLASKIMSKEAILFVEESAREQRRLFCRHSLYPNPHPLFGVLLESNALIRVENECFDEAFVVAIEMVRKKKYNFSFLTIIFRWQGCSHWRILPEEFGKDLEIFSKNPILRYKAQII